MLEDISSKNEKKRGISSPDILFGISYRF